VPDERRSAPGDRNAAGDGTSAHDHGDVKTASQIGPGAEHPVRRNPVPALLTSLLGDSLDPGYAAAAQRRATTVGPPDGRRGPARWWYWAAGLLAVGLVLGIAARATAASAPSAEHTRSALLGDVRAAQQRVDSLAARASVLAAGIRSAQQSLGATALLSTVAGLEQDGGMTPVHGPGLRIVIDNASDAGGPGAIQDSDIDLLVNGLWASGAEAVSVGGVRLRTTSTIRQAGGAMLVDNTPVFFPIAIDAVGDPSTLHVAIVTTEGFARFSAFASLYHIRFDLEAKTDITLPAAPGPDLRYASAVPTSR